MKNNNKTSKRWLAGVIAVSLLAIFLSSCVKNQTVTPNPPAALVTFIQASPDEPTVDLFFGTDQVNLNPLNYGDIIDYFKAYTGKRNVIIYNHTNQAKIVSDTVNLVANTPYSLFLANKATSPELVLITDSVSNPANGKATIRFINLSPDAPAADLAVTGGSVLVTNKKYKAFSSFVPVTGNQNYNFQILQTGTSTVLASLNNISINAGYVYTIYLSGLATPTSATDKLSGNLQINAIYY